jgi:hypothetical protein
MCGKKEIKRCVDTERQNMEVNMRENIAVIYNELELGKENIHRIMYL